MKNRRSIEDFGSRGGRCQCANFDVVSCWRCPGRNYRRQILYRQHYTSRIPIAKLEESPRATRYSATIKLIWLHQCLRNSQRPKVHGNIVPGLSKLFISPTTRLWWHATDLASLAMIWLDKEHNIQEPLKLHQWQLHGHSLKFQAANDLIVCHRCPLSFLRCLNQKSTWPPLHRNFLIPEILANPQILIRSSPQTPHHPIHSPQWHPAKPRIAIGQWHFHIWLKAPLQFRAHSATLQYPSQPANAPPEIRIHNSSYGRCVGGNTCELWGSSRYWEGIRWCWDGD